jgi:hypothetical protein
VVYLYEKGHSRRGASFRVPYTGLVESGCRLLIDRVTQTEDCSSISDASSEASLAFSEVSTTGVSYELYIPAPANVDRRDVFRYHLTTRNLLAFIFGRALVSTNLGQALVDLTERLQALICPAGNSVEHVLRYTRNQGYSDCANNPDIALAMLFYAEHYGVKDLWLNAFIHCVGMSDRLSMHHAYQSLTECTKAMIMCTRISMEMKLELSWASLENFDPLSLSGRQNIQAGLRTQSDSFCAFLTEYHTEKYGAWPPALDKLDQNPRDIFEDMLFDFHSLYEHLADKSAASRAASSKPIHSASQFVLTELEQFDRMHHYKSLQSRLPRLPKTSIRNRITSLGVTKLRTNFRPLQRPMSIKNRRAAIAKFSAATNTPFNVAYTNPLIREYMSFESRSILRAEAGLSPHDIRRVQWSTIYAVLQVLMSVTAAPKEGQNTMNVDYFICLDIPSTV